MLCGPRCCEHLLLGVLKHAACGVVFLFLIHKCTHAHAKLQVPTSCVSEYSFRQGCATYVKFIPKRIHIRAQSQGRACNVDALYVEFNSFQNAFTFTHNRRGVRAMWVCRKTWLRWRTGPRPCVAALTFGELEADFACVCVYVCVCVSVDIW